MNMQKSEKKHRIYNDQSKYLKHRRIIVDWMCEVGEEFKLGPLTIHCSVRFLDRVLSSLDVAKNRLQLVAMACILIASKHEETEDVTPTLNELNECSNNAYSIDALKEMEVSVLRHLGWQLALITPIHFLQFYQARGIIFHTDLFEGGPSNRKSALKYVRKYADFFAELCLQEYSFQQYLPSVMAAAVIAAARRAVKIDPIWNSGLEGLTTYNEKDIFPAYKQLYNYYTESFPTAPHVYPSPRSVVEFEARGGAALWENGTNNGIYISKSFDLHFFRLHVTPSKYLTFFPAEDSTLLDLTCTISRHTQSLSLSLANHCWYQKF